MAEKAILNKMKIKLTLSIISLILYLGGYCQGYLGFNDAPMEGMFVKYKSPICPSIFCSEDTSEINFLSIHIAVRVMANKDSTASLLDFSPLYGFTSDFPPDSPVWRECENSIKEASKEWVFMPIWKHYEKSEKDESLILVPNEYEPLYLFIFGFYQYNSKKAYISTVGIDIH